MNGGRFEGSLARGARGWAAALALAGVLAACGGSETASNETASGGSSGAGGGSGGLGGSGGSLGGGGASEGGGIATSTGSGGAGGSTTTSTGAGGAGVGGAGGSGSGGAGGGAGGQGTGGAGGSPPAGLASLGTLVVLGDSIGDGGGQPPFYYDLLKADLKAKYGNVAYHNKADSGSKTGALKSQIKDLPNQLPGPVAVVITSGGNDMKAALPQIVLGADDAAKATLGANIDAALDLLVAPGQFGPGVSAHVFEANIYDSSDGAGDFGQNGCAFGKGLPPIPTDAFFAEWNGVIADQVAQHGQVLTDIHDHFYGHGYKGKPSWYAKDCTHPNTLGHDQLRRLFYYQITGEMLP